MDGPFRQPATLMVIASAPTYVATREALKVLSPQDLTPVRFLAAALVLACLLAIRRKRLTLNLKNAPRVITVGLLGYASYGLLLNLGQTAVPAGTTSLLLNISPVFAFFLGYTLLNERTTRTGYLGIMIAVIGVVVITLGDSGSMGFNKEALFIVAAALILAVFLIVQQPLLKSMPPLEVVFWGSLIGGLTTLPTASFHVTSRPTGAFWLAIVVLVVISTVLAYSFWNVSLARTSVAEGGSLLYVVPVFSLLLGWMLLGEVPSLTSIIGGMAALTGVIMLSKAAPPVAPKVFEVKA